MPNRSYLLSLALSSLLIAPMLAQNTAPDSALATPTFHVTSRSVVVNVVVTDKGGRAVTGVHREQFQIFEDGKPQVITSFEEHSGIPTLTGESGANPPPSSPPLPADTFSNVPEAPPSDSVNLLLMDALNTPIANQSLVHLQMVKYLATILPGTRMGVFTLSERLRMIQGVTADSSTLQAAIARSAANPNQSGLLPTAEGTAANREAVGAISSSTSKLADAANALQEFQNQQAEFAMNQRVVYTLDALQQIARYLAGVPGRKNLIWFSGSFPLCQLKHTKCPYKQQMDETMDVLAKAQVSIYPIGASGLAPDAINDASAPPDHSLDANLAHGASPSQVATKAQVGSLSAGSAERNNTRDTMESFARETGGQAIYNSNDLRGALERDIANGSRYYTVSYTPPQDSASGKMHSIKLQLATGKYKLAYRRYYFGQTSKAIKTEATVPSGDPLHPMMQHGMPDFTELLYRIRMVPVAPQPAADVPRAGENAALPGPATRYRVNFMLGMGGLDLSQSPDGKRSGAIEVALVAYSRGGKPLNWELRTVCLAVTPQQFDAAQHAGIPFQLDLDIPKGDVFLRSGILDLSSHRAGTIEIPLSAVTALDNAALAEKPSPPKTTAMPAPTRPPESAKKDPQSGGLPYADDATPPPPAVATNLPPVIPRHPGNPRSSIIFWSLSSKQVSAMLAAPPSGSDARYARLRSYFIQAGCKQTRMEEEPIPQHPDRNLICTLPGSEAGEIVVTAHYERRQDEDASADTWDGAVMLAMLYKSLQAAPRHYTYVFAELYDDDGEKQFLTSLSSAHKQAPVAAVALDLPGSGPLQYKLSWNAYLMAWAQPGGDPASLDNARETTSSETGRTKELRAGEQTKTILVSTLNRSTQVNGIPQPLNLKLSHAVKNAQLFRHSTDIPSILIYATAAPHDAASQVSAPQMSDTSGRATTFDLFANYLCALDGNLTSPASAEAHSTPAH